MDMKYFSTVKFIFIKATYDLFPNTRIKIFNSLNNGVLGEFVNTTSNKIFEAKDIEAIKVKMHEIIRLNLPINKIDINFKLLNNSYFKSRTDIENLIRYSPNCNISIYKIDGVYDFVHNELFKSTGFIDLFNILKYEKRNQFILKVPLNSQNHSLPKNTSQPKLEKIFSENRKWGEILNISNVGELNKLIFDNKIGDIIRVNEALHEKKLVHIADKIQNCRDIKVVTIAGPSSSGKTTFSKRLAIQLMSSGITPLLISLDDYYKNREFALLDKTGEKDFESIDALDLKLLNENLIKLMKGEEVEIPQYNFYKGERESIGKKVKINKNGIVLIEGIHGLNDKLTELIDKKNKLKIYISCLTQLNIDDHNRIPTSKVRKIRRLVRDSMSRGISAVETLQRWDAVRKGETDKIFPFQEEADILFDSNLFYELGVLKCHATKELKTIESTNEYYDEAQRLIEFLKYFRKIDKNLVPDNSILKEFIGGSYFYEY